MIPTTYDFRIGLYNLFFEEREGDDPIGRFDNYMRNIGVGYSSWFFDLSDAVVITTDRPLSACEEMALTENGVGWFNCVLP